jgi:hypothetical protein
MNLKKQPARDMVVQQFERQRTRGVEGFGFVADIGTPFMKKRTKEIDIKREIKKCDANEILFHHRFPTSTENVKNACHPFKIKGIKTNHWYYVVHNGVITNTSELKEKHDKLKIKYKSLQPDGRFNDSEALAVEIMLYLDGEQENIEARGSIAFICLEFDENSKKKHLHFARNAGNELHYRFRLGSSFQIASEGPWPVVKQDTLHTLNYETMEIEEKPINLQRFLEVTNTAPDERREFSGYWDDPKNWKEKQYVSYYRYLQEFDKRFENDTDYSKGFDDAADLQYATDDDIFRAEDDRYELIMQLEDDQEEYKEMTTNKENFAIKRLVLKEILKIKKQIKYYDGFLDGLRYLVRKALEDGLPFGEEN